MEHGATIMLATPTFYQQYLRRCKPEQFAKIRIAAVGAEKLKRPLAEELLFGKLANGGQVRVRAEGEALKLEVNERETEAEV